MKHIYFIRHGQTDANRGSVHQSSDESLNAKGVRQAHHAALYFKDKHIDTLISSPYARARETAHIIGEEIGLPFSTEGSIVEFKRPNKLYGQSYYSLASFLYLIQFFIHQEDPVWDNDGAENMFNARNRVLDAKRAISAVPGENILVVSHAVFMDMFLQLVCLEKRLSLFQFVHGLLLSKKTPNTGIIHLVFDDSVPKGMCQWQLIEFINPKIDVTA